LHQIFGDAFSIAGAVNPIVQQGFIEVDDGRSEANTEVNDPVTKPSLGQVARTQVTLHCLGVVQDLRYAWVDRGHHVNCGLFAARDEI